MASSLLLILLAGGLLTAATGSARSEPEMLPQTRKHGPISESFSKQQTFFISKVFTPIFLKKYPFLRFGSGSKMFPISESVQSRHQIHPLRLRSGAGGSPVSGLCCLSWRLAVEAHNIIDWETVPLECKDYVGHYMLGHQYREDSRTVAVAALLYAQSLSLAGDGKDVWVFDVDETVLSNLPFYAQHGFGSEPFNSTAFKEWVIEAKAPALPESLELYNKLLALGFKIAFITTRSEEQRSIVGSNLNNVGYHTWEKLMLKGSADQGLSTSEYKSSQREKLEKEGYRVRGNMGDQWTDISGTHVGDRTFKLPNPMYYNI